MKPNRTCFLTELDLTRLEKIALAPTADPRLRDMLDDVLERATIVESRDVPSNIVTMNSQATLVDDDGNETTWTLVYPADADFAAQRLNVFSPLGLALLGAKKGMKVRFTPPSGAAQSLKIDRILFQPEAADNFTL